MSESFEGDLTWIGEVGIVFEDAWREGQAPKIEEYLTGASGRRRAELLRHLLEIEIDLREAAGESPSPSEYGRRFPDDLEGVRSAFERTRLAGTGRRDDADGLGEGGGRGEGDGEPSDSRFRLVRHHDSGGLGDVYIALDEEFAARTLSKPGRQTSSTTPSAVKSPSRSVVS